MSRAHVKADGTLKWGASSKAVAEARAAGMQRKTTHPLSAYKCPECPLWHIGRTPSVLSPTTQPLSKEDE